MVVGEIKNINQFTPEPVKKNTHQIFIDSDIGNGKFSGKSMTLDVLQRMIVSTKVLDYTIVDADETILTNAAGLLTITLPSAIGRAGKVFVIKRIDAIANTVVTPVLAQTIDGAATQTLAAQFDSIKIASDGTNWFIIP